MDSGRNSLAFHEDYMALHCSAAAHGATSSYDEDLSPAPFSQDALIFKGVTQINDPQPQNYKFMEETLTLGADFPRGWLPPVPEEIGYPGPTYPTTVYSTNLEGHFLNQPLYPWTENGHQNNLYGSQPLGIDLLGLRSETIPAVQIPYRQLQRYFMQFLMTNLPLLHTVINSTPEAMAIIQDAFVEDLHRSGLIPYLSAINKMFQQFEPIIGSCAIRQESDSRKTKTVKRACPFQFCPGHFTRAAGLKNHLSAHFGLAPNQCPHCSKFYSDASFRRHMGSCRKADSHSIAQSLQM